MTEVTAAMTREDLIEEVTRIDYWGARSLGSSRRTARAIVAMLEDKGLLALPTTEPPVRPRTEGEQDCPVCGQRVTWDTEHEPNAWRHAHDSRWCESVGGDSPRYPPGATDRDRRN